MPHPRYSAYPPRIVLARWVYFAYAPQGVGLLCGLVCHAAEKDIYGWWIGARDSEFEPAYFALEGFYSTAATRFLATQASDLYGGWVFDCSQLEPRSCGPIAVSDSVCHELEALQAEFAQEWLFFRDDPGEQKEVAAYESAGLAVQPVNIRHHCLDRFERRGPVWLYASGGIDMNAIDFMRQRWPLDYKVE